MGVERSASENSATSPRAASSPRRTALPFPRFVPREIRLEEAVDGGDSVLPPIGQAGRDQLALGIAELDDPSIDRAVADHAGIILRPHADHLAVVVPGLEIAGEQLELLLGRDGIGDGRPEIASHCRVGTRAVVS